MELRIRNYVVYMLCIGYHDITKFVGESIHSLDSQDLQKVFIHDMLRDIDFLMQCGLCAD